MTIKDLIAKLQQHPETMKVAFQWEGGLCNPLSFRVENHEGKDYLEIDVDSYGSFTRED